LAGGINDNADHWRAVLMTPLTIFEFQLGFLGASGVNDAAGHWWVVSMTLLTIEQRCH
jgi:hypothetical protein